MPKCGSQIAICDLPVRFDTYTGCSHDCSYCFARSKYDIRSIKNNEGVKSLRNFINGTRGDDTSWCDWNIPIHWGGVSDPFQPIEQVRGVSLDCLKLFAETQYPFVVSTKSSLVASPKYFDLIKQCNCVVQFSVVCERYDKYEKGASTFSERIEAAKKISKHKRVIARVQPYLPSIFYDVMKSIERFANAGIYGATFESMKKKSKAEGMVRVGGDMVYPVNILKEHFSAFKDRLHSLGMKFYSAENRLRAMGDDLCCCGVDGMGFRTNTFNANHYLYDKKNFVPTDRMAKAPAYCFKSKRQDTIHGEFFTVNSFKDIMTWELGKSSVLNQLKPTDEYATQATRNNKHTAAP